MGLANGRYASNDNSDGHANKWKAKHETGNANSEIVVSVHETMKSNHEMSAEGMGRTFCPTPKMATAVAGHPASSIWVRRRRLGLFNYYLGPHIGLLA